MAIQQRRASVLLSTVAIPLLYGCSSGTNGPVSISLDRSTVLVSSPVQITVSGLDPGEAATIAVESTDQLGELWSSSASFNADPRGTIDLSHAKPNAGSYAEADAMGLFWSMKPSEANPLQTALTGPSGDELDRIVVTARSQQVAVRNLVRQLYGPGVLVTFKRTPMDTFYGDYFQPADVSIRKPALLIFGGSEGGLSGTLVAEQLASIGYPALSLAYFGEPGLATDLLNVPLEYFAGALSWLSQQPGVDPGHLVVLGVSRGGEAALLLGADYPDLVHGVVALVPSAYVNCSYPACKGSAWTINGRPIPFTPESQALIPVAKIQGSLFITCGNEDAVWPSCLYTDRIKDELAAGFPYPQTILEYPDAGHGIGAMVPFTSWLEPLTTQGKTPASNELAREQAWPKLLAFLHGIASG